MKKNKEVSAIIITDNDDVITAIKDLKKGEDAEYLFGGNEIKKVILKNDIPFGHKIAIRDISVKKDIIKYGESIGKATMDIKAGEHVHIHNLESNRGRGDLK